MFRWEKLDFTVSFIKATKQWRIPGFRLFRDLDSIQNLINLDVWPGPSIIHQFYKKVGEEIGKKQPGLFVLNFGLHPIAHDMRPDVYETFLRETVRWWRKGTKATDEVRTDIPMLWRRTTVTHFPANELNLMHRCLLPDRLKVYDSIALRVMEELDVPVLDWKTPGQGRAGAQNDNRHFRDKECTGTRVQGTNMGLLLNMVGSMRNWDMTQRIGYTDTYHKQYKGAESR
ncbi:hypothetical protein SARC_10309 [Sphaeroforma arctica JP610]|uniref:Uncharacterized protein n=1 Tax=Sphaeroforma arctica JP610 TaxID=667725 RepID=A0A0L0FL79_9EUKA|nr:hypothetical protein SARC_10309 [Sphaeroforma arctica JP610]KNC77226.1 hypothetical protein SARC_10309 [Sphaeroforma arctica JP610]|eukprot:XP_014151128.1 hypothetical protein SARC_10309 [Sphaeroforma arctica JP610]